MFEKAKPGRDAFTFSLGGMRAIASFTPAPAIVDDRINKAIDERLGKGQDDQLNTSQELPPSWGRFWMLRRFRRAA